MRLRFLALLGFSALAVPAPALAETCTIEITGPADQWKFVHVHDVAARTIVLRQAIKVGDSKEVTVSGDRVRVDWKLPGYAKYRAGAETSCKGGNRIKV